MRDRRLVFLVALLAMPAAVAASGDESCRALGSADFGRLQDAPTRITSADVVAAKDGVPAHCRVEGYVSPQVGVELRLPLGGGWNGKVLTQGCGAMCGQMLGSEACAEATSRGYACVTTDMGHRGLPYDGKWAYNNPQAEIDFGHRATHVATLAAKAIAASFYGVAPQRAYFRGCSTGGRQALVAAQRYPYDFDGIVGGAPVLYQLMGPPLQLFWGATANLDRAGKPILDVAKLPLIAAAATRACDTLDGVADGVIDRPMQCRFDPATLQCPASGAGAPTAQCLTAAEVEVVRRMYSGPVTSRGVQIMPGGQVPGSEPGWAAYFRGGKAAPNYGFAAEILRYVAFAIDPGPDYEATDFDWDRDPQRMSVSALTAGNPDLTLFRAAGGKLLLFHGLQDPAVFYTTTTAYYELASRAMGGREAMQSFARLFLLPGMYHCRGGPGLNHADMLGALEAWVERGQAPESITAHHIEAEARGPVDPPVGFDPASAGFSRPVYPYPDYAVYRGSGDWKDARNYVRRRVN